MKQLERIWTHFLAVLFLGAVVGCAQLGLQKAQSAQDTVQYGKAIATGVYDTLAQNVNVSIPPAEARDYFDRVKAQRQNLDAAQKVADGLPAGADSTDVRTKVQGVLSVLQVISAELKSRYPTLKVVEPKVK